MAEHSLKKGELGKALEFAERLYATATEHEVHKYIAVAHHLRAKVCVAAGDLSEAEKNFDLALAELETYPAPLVAWKVHAGRARLKMQLGQEAEAQESSACAAEIVNFIASNVTDETLRTNFLKATRDVL
jgi:ATP/maltotriose-dependent transcriptional regulator MalT